MKRLNPSIKHHLLIGILLGIWLFIFAFLIRPFDDGTISLKVWVLISTGFSLIAFLCYGVLAVIQKRIYYKRSEWNVGFEIMSLIFFQLFYAISTYGFYKSPVLDGGYDFLEFVSTITLKLALISTPILVLARMYVVTLIPARDDRIIIRGENKLDILNIKKSDLICVSNAQNYVEIFFIDGNDLKTKLIRSTLKKIQSDCDFLIQVHRSHLINPSHFKAWKNQDTIFLTQLEIPVSKNYRERLLSL
ncbi:LytTR family transcriptional regulator [Chryseobacterium sp. RP-3-3]|uniref:LytTR family transcriptional regulator n=1 Tax=Chryseobacterium antibioticum TaxID=2728847 RepID=A0A7Y0AME3_9FLAO|nr:LytTR family DNA-binding domain-containing protein [Chryseobacterium antibioticum]NML69860.1 LytTR family transcriptional regulator [Chryseobacterium antibioticum]